MNGQPNARPGPRLAVVTDADAIDLEACEATFGRIVHYVNNQLTPHADKPAEMRKIRRMIVKEVIGNYAEERTPLPISA